MRVVIAPDSFKECLSAKSVAAAIARGWQRGAPHHELVQVPLADGGEGSTAALVESLGGRLHEVRVTGPLGADVRANYGLVGDGETVIIEVAEASGLHRVAADSRNAMRATSYGTGELINAAVAHRPRKLILCLGGSATTDGGAGILRALGARLLDADGRDIPAGGEGLLQLASLEAAPALEKLEGIELTVACDVSNPLLGARGAAAVFGPQKGATPAQVETLNDALGHFATIAGQSGHDIHSFAGSGAAGGIGGMMVGILGAKARPGIELIMDAAGLAQQLVGADLVITAEGAIDSQSSSGKTPAGVAALARQSGIPVVGLAGRVGDDLSALHEAGLTAAFSITPAPVSLAEAIHEAENNLVTTSEQLARLAEALIDRGHSGT